MKELTRQEKIELAIEDVDSWIDIWHCALDNKQELHEFLNMEWEEYQLFSTKPSEWAEEKITAREAFVESFND